MRTRVQKWGNSLALRIPKAFALELGMQEDGEVELTVEKGRLVAVPPIVPVYTLDELLAGVRPSNLHSESDWGPPVGKEVW
ncbi:MAG: AbrB/MazE/SpoVT family DNA-binding domain-containing protein [Acidobacteria bacterium]|nr:AbrB/MazE/SpoVT family DNA-binding domain-containing protein [Acidobacteriota bacterium]